MIALSNTCRTYDYVVTYTSRLFRKKGTECGEWTPQSPLVETKVLTIEVYWDG